jgi:hypothetical protein
MRIYLASSWRNPYYDECLRLLKEAGHDVYNFRDPRHAFNWDQIDPNWAAWELDTYLEALEHPLAQAGYRRDKEALDWCQMCVLLLPSGRSAHLEAGYAIGQGKHTHVVLPPLLDSADLMNLLAGKKNIHRNISCLIEALDVDPRLGPDDPICDHKHYKYEKHGRRCTCGTLMVDPGD